MTLKSLWTISFANSLWGRDCQFEIASIAVKWKENVMINLDRWTGVFLIDMRYYYIVIAPAEGLGKTVYLNWKWKYIFHCSVAL